MNTPLKQQLQLLRHSLRPMLRNKGALVAMFALAAVTLGALFAPWIAPHNPSEVFHGFYKLPPFWSANSNPHFWLGTDDLGRDLFSRLLFGARVSLAVGAEVVLLSVTVGTALGVLAGYVGGWVDSLIMRFVDMLMSLPSILLAIVVVAVLGPSLSHGILAVSVVALPGVIRVVRASVIAEKKKLYVEASRSFGASHWRLSVIDVLPNCLAPIIVQATLGFSDGILNVAALGFLGLGAQPPIPEWGAMLADARAYIDSASWLVTLPGVCILVVVVCFNVLGDSLRDALDPRLRDQDKPL